MNFNQVLVFLPSPPPPTEFRWGTSNIRAVSWGCWNLHSCCRWLAPALFFFFYTKSSCSGLGHGRHHSSLLVLGCRSWREWVALPWVSIGKRWAAVSVLAKGSGFLLYLFSKVLRCFTAGDCPVVWALVPCGALTAAPVTPQHFQTQGWIPASACEVREVVASSGGNRGSCQTEANLCFQVRILKLFLCDLFLAPFADESLSVWQSC